MLLLGGRGAFALGVFATGCWVSCTWESKILRCPSQCGDVHVWALSIWAALNVMDVLLLSLRSG